MSVNFWGSLYLAQGMRQWLCISPDFTESGCRASEFVGMVLCSFPLKLWESSGKSSWMNSLEIHRTESLEVHLCISFLEEVLKRKEPVRRKEKKPQSINKPVSPWLTEKSAFTLEQRGEAHVCIGIQWLKRIEFVILRDLGANFHQWRCFTWSSLCLFISGVSFVASVSGDLVGDLCALLQH